MRTLIPSFSSRYACFVRYAVSISKSESENFEPKLLSPSLLFFIRGQVKGLTL